MNEIDAGIKAHKLDEDCIKKSPGHKMPVARHLNDFEMERDDFCIFFENYKHSKGIDKRCLIYWVKTQNLKSKEIGNDLIIFEEPTQG